MWFRQAEQEEAPAQLCSWQTGGCRWQDRQKSLERERAAALGKVF